jgi:trehalose-6-phosphate synthase
MGTDELFERVRSVNGESVVVPVSGANKKRHIWMFLERELFPCLHFRTRLHFPVNVIQREWKQFVYVNRLFVVMQKAYSQARVVSIWLPALAY